jgi:ABC-2 type transport system ATP-binding protein
VTARLLGPPPTTGPDSAPLPPDCIRDDRLTLSYRGELPRLLQWLAGQPLADLKVEPQGLTPIYRRFHG